MHGLSTLPGGAAVRTETEVGEDFAFCDAIGAEPVDGRAHPLFVASLLSDPLDAVLDAILPVESSAVIIHLGQDFTFHRPLAPGDSAEVVCSGVAGMPVRSGHQLAVGFDVLVRGRLAVSGLGTFFTSVRPTIALQRPDPDIPTPRPPRPARRLSGPRWLAEDLGARYAEASGDRQPIHVDPEAALAFGFESTILHGMCVLGHCVAGATLLLGRRDASLRSVSARFTRPVLPGSTLVVEATRLDEGCGVVRGVVDRTVVLRRGVVTYA